MGYKKIGDYGVIGDGKTVALIGSDASVDWMCLPYMDSPSVFAAVLDDEKGGAFRISPLHAWDSVQTYLHQTNILKTRFRTETGEAEVLDFMPPPPDDQSAPHRSGLVRCIDGISGNMPLQIECALRFDYGRHRPQWHQSADGWAISHEGSAAFLWTSSGFSWHEERSELTIEAGERVWLVLGDGDVPPAFSESELSQMLDSAVEYWRAWVQNQETGKYPVSGFWQDILDRSALVLKLLQLRETGAIAAAPTCSLPTIVYGQRNWDYRFSWIRDTSMTLNALFELGHMKEVSLYMSWLEKIIGKQEVPTLDVLYQLRAPEPPSGEQRLDHLAGYKGSRPVLIGQYNIGQTQHDIYGELLSLFFSMSRIAGKIDPAFWRHIKRLIDYVVTIWRNEDHGIWELRTGPHHVSHSKLMCWVALDRGIKIAEHYGFPGDVESWRSERRAVRADLLENGYNRKRGSFTQYYGSDLLDASLLRIPLMGFLPVQDPRVENTIRAVEQELLQDGVVLRYTADDGLPGKEHGFLICLFWYLRCLVLQKRFDEVEWYLRRMDRISNHLGLFGEQYDPVYQEITGNIPQAFSHIGYATTVLEYLEARQPRAEPSPMPLREKLALAFKARLLTPGRTEKKGREPENPGSEAKRVMNNLIGRFYDGHSQKIDYPLIASTDYYRHFLAMVSSLEDFDLAILRSDAEKKAFWINIFNVMVIHGVIALGIKSSVKEVPFFFDRVQYRIGAHLFTLSDIEHGILRKNRRPPARLRKRFRSDDPRTGFCVETVDPRIHFALVCATLTCPPVESYEETRIGEQLDTSARVFINGNTRLELQKKRVHLSEIFKWYEDDFRQGAGNLIPFVAQYLYDEGNADWLRANVSAVQIRYVPYDWRLNR